MMYKARHQTLQPMEAKRVSQDCFLVNVIKVEKKEAFEMTKPVTRPAFQGKPQPTPQRLWALAAGCVPDAAPWDIPRIAAQAGFTSSGMWVDPATTWGPDALIKTKRAIAETGIKLLDVEVIWLEQGPAPTTTQRQIVDVGLSLKAKNVLVVSRQPDEARAVKQFRSLCKQAGDDIRIVLEFGEFTEVKSLAHARRFIDQVNHPAAGILVDLMHLNRSGESLPELTDKLFPYVQACDFEGSSRLLHGMDYIVAAVDGRCPLGEGDADPAALQSIRQAVIDVSLEIRSKELRTHYPDPFERAGQIFQRCS